VILPNIDKAVIESEKLQDYLLSKSHPIGRFKAEFFQSIGFADDNWMVLEAEIRALLGNDAKIREKTEYGEKYEIRGTIAGPTGQRAEIVTAWIILTWIILTGEEISRFITAYPGGK
jgi:hypothetical protein